jgi:predicted DNA-binding transcriptional regulator AlpA
MGSSEAQTSNNPADPDELLTTEGVSEWLIVPVRTLYKWRRLGTGPRSIRVGRWTRYRRSDVEDWLDERSSPRPA